MRTYTLQIDEQHKVPEDARNLRLERDLNGDKIVTFQSDSGPIEENTDCQCDQCEAEQDATPNSLTPRRKTPEGWE